MKLSIKSKNPDVENGKPFIYGIPKGEELVAWQTYMAEANSGTFPLKINDRKGGFDIPIKSVALNTVGASAVIVFELGDNINTDELREVFSVHSQDVVAMATQQPGGQTSVEVVNLAIYPQQLQDNPGRFADMVIHRQVTGS